MNNLFYSLTYAELELALKKLKFNENLAKVVFDKIYKLKTPAKDSTPILLFQTLEANFDFKLPVIKSTQKAEDGTFKFLIQFADGLSVETVLIPFFKKYTVCLSSQVGCAMKCSFCYTGTQNLKRNLTSAEIVSQYLVAFNFLKENIDSKASTPNIVFMGQGEPLHNFDELKKAIHLLTDVKATHIGPRQITVSTAGFIPGLKRFNELNNVNLAVSFHSPKNKIRDELIPLNRKYPIQILLEELSQIKLLKRQYITFEYLLIDQINNSFEDASELAELISGQKAIVNLIPFNPFPGSTYQKPSTESVIRFKDWLVDMRVHTLVRTTKGDDILAACGQLNT